MAPRLQKIWAMIPKTTEGPTRMVRTFLESATGIVLLAAILTSCSALRRPGPQPDRSEDARITADIERRLREEPVLESRDLRVDVDGRVASLYGTVEGMGEWNCALRNAGLVPGVSSVADYLLIERGPRDVTCEAPRPLD